MSQRTFVQKKVLRPLRRLLYDYADLGADDRSALPDSPVFAFDLSLRWDRYHFHLLNSLVDRQHPGVVLRRISRRDFGWRFDRYGDETLRWPGLVLGQGRIRLRPEQRAAATLVTDRPLPARKAAAWGRVVTVRTDLASLPPSGPWLKLPFGPHPHQLPYLTADHLSAHRRRSHRAAVLFAGNATAGYGRDTGPLAPLIARFGLIHRLQALQIARETFGTDLVTIRTAEDEVRVFGPAVDPTALPTEELEQTQFASDPPPLAQKGAESRLDRAAFAETPSGAVPFALADAQHRRFEFARWFQRIAQSTAFLALPGLRMPHCHNVTEAMSVGTVPIIQYGAWLDPPLTDGETAICFHDEASLRDALRRPASLSATDRTALRTAVTDYYDRFLDPRSIRRQILAAPRELTVFLNTSTVAQLGRVRQESVALTPSTWLNRDLPIETNQ